MNLEIGKYVRTCNGTIFKIVGGNEDKWDIDISYSCLSRLEDEDYTSYAYNKNNSFFKALAKKASHSLIDLIELGDYVNGLAVTRICVDEETEKKHLNMYGSLSEWENEDIKSIVTKEQFNSVKYEVK
mgnify:FL=1